MCEIEFECVEVMLNLQGEWVKQSDENCVN